MDKQFWFDIRTNGYAIPVGYSVPELEQVRLAARAFCAVVKGSNGVIPFAPTVFINRFAALRTGRTPARRDASDEALRRFREQA